MKMGRYPTWLQKHNKPINRVDHRIGKESKNYSLAISTLILDPCSMSTVN